ncbi:uncharacterized protein LOC143888404 [Tasmannia lanceolata]|uniref:uncharacterized protein LOC143888404 n=1 Tax=Tasmannia lanceolata TaxID=3420 RepID=UPI00406481BC
MTIRDMHSFTTWTMYFDGASNSKGKGVGIVLISSQDEHIPISIKLDFDYTNNVAEYEACIAGLEAALSLESFHNISFTYISRLRNRFADALATLASMVDIPVGVKVRPLAIKRHVVPAHIHMVQIAARCLVRKPWYFDIKNLIFGRGNPPEASLTERRASQKLASRYVICGGDQYRRSFDGVQLLCADDDRAAKILEDVHSGGCGPHMNGKMLARKILHLGYFWTTLEADCFSFVKTCHNVYPHIYWSYSLFTHIWHGSCSAHRVDNSVTQNPDGKRSTGIEWARIRHQELCMLDEKRLKTTYHVQGYQRILERAFNKKVRIRELREGDMVLRECRASIFDPRGKFRPNWSGSYGVDESLPGKAVRLLDQNGDRIPEPTNLDQLKR